VHTSPSHRQTLFSKATRLTRTRDAARVRRVDNPFTLCCPASTGQLRRRSSHTENKRERELSECFVGAPPVRRRTSPDSIVSVDSPLACRVRAESCHLSPNDTALTQTSNVMYAPSSVEKDSFSHKKRKLFGERSVRSIVIHVQHRSTSHRFSLAFEFTRALQLALRTINETNRILINSCQRNFSTENIDQSISGDDDDDDDNNNNNNNNSKG
jgi:hypothetical protein